MEKVEDNWRDFLDQIKLTNPTTYNGLKETKLACMDNTILLFKFVSKLSLLEFEEYKIDFLKIIREKLNNYYIDIETIIEENTSSTFKAITKLDVSKELVTKHPLFQKLIEDFDLDIY
ncbi:MAG: hypothetical protein ACEQSF_01845 [Solirubrobacteraceae bacterium]